MKKEIHLNLSRGEHQFRTKIDYVYNFKHYTALDLLGGKVLKTKRYDAYKKEIVETLIEQFRNTLNETLGLSE